VRAWLAIAVVFAAAPVAAKPAASPRAKERAWLGIVMKNGPDGVQVTDVIDDSPAELCGLAPGDEILAVADSRTRTMSELTHVLDDYRVGDRVQLRLVREGSRFATTAILGERFGRNELLSRHLVGRKAPSFDLEVVSGLSPAKLGDLRGRVVILDLFATHCDPCRRAHEVLERVASERAADGLVVLAVSAEPRDRLEMYGRDVPDLTVARDPTGEVFGAYSPYDNERPVLVVIDREGVVRFAGIGGEDGVPSVAEALENVDNASFAAARALRARR
jgi:thiol-disulfide isomerase/thioredoxin